MDANLLLFKTVIAGDSWGELAVPVIQKHPATAIIFVGSQLTLVFGVVNLIVAVATWLHEGRAVFLNVPIRVFGCVSDCMGTHAPLGRKFFFLTVLKKHLSP